MLTITVAQFKNDIAPKMKGTSIREVKDFYGTAAGASNRVLSRLNPACTIRTVTMQTPFYDNVVDYPLATDYKDMIDIRPQVNRLKAGNSEFSQTTPKQFLTKLTSNSFSIRWNNMIRTLRSQILPIGNVATMDEFDGSTSNGLWVASADASGLYEEPLNFVQGNGALGMNLSGATGIGTITNTTAAITDLSALRYEDDSMLYYYIPLGYSSRFTSFSLVRGSDASNYVKASVTTKADGTAFTDGWNFLLFKWGTATKVGTPDDTKNTYRQFNINYSIGTAINNCLIDAWTDSLGALYEMEYYSEYMFRDGTTGAWKQAPTSDSDLVNVDINLYEILKAEMMVDITNTIRTGAVKETELAEWRLQLNGQPQSRYVKDPPYHGLYADYLSRYPDSSLVNITQTYQFDV